MIGAVDQLEPLVAEIANQTQRGEVTPFAVMSAAISLKRIADLLENVIGHHDPINVCVKAEQ